MDWSPTRRIATRRARARGGSANRTLTIDGLRRRRPGVVGSLADLPVIDAPRSDCHDAVSSAPRSGDEEYTSTVCGKSDTAEESGEPGIATLFRESHADIQKYDATRANIDGHVEQFVAARIIARGKVDGREQYR